MKKLIKAWLKKLRSLFSTKKAINKRELTLKQVKIDIALEKCKRIYYSQTTLWWTHDPADLHEATAIGKKYCEARHKAEMKNKKISRERKSQMQGLYNSFINAKNLPPLDFVGNPIYETEDLEKWITGAENNIEQFGRNGIKAFMRMHHKNCQGKAFASWDEVNFDIDGIPAITNVTIEAPVRKLNPDILPGRNELCPCGSGKKHKHCHGLLNNHQKPSES